MCEERSLFFYDEQQLNVEQRAGDKNASIYFLRFHEIHFVILAHFIVVHCSLFASLGFVFLSVCYLCDLFPFACD